MAKKKAARDSFNMSEAIRGLLQDNPGQTSREVFEGLQKAYPDQKINRNSCNVAFSHARRKLGLQKGGKVAVKRLRPSVASNPSASGTLNLGALQAARELITFTGSPEAAIEAIQQLQSLQLN